MVRKHSSVVYHGGALRMLEPDIDVGRRPFPVPASPRAQQVRTRARAVGLLAGGPALAMAAVALMGVGTQGCASTSSSGGAPGTAPGRAAGGPAPATTATMAGARCHDGHCSCRKGGKDDVETAPPDADHKRFEIRVDAEDGDATLDSPTLGRFSAGAGGGEACFYVDVLPATHHIVTFTAREGRPTGGLSPSLRVAEYGPKGPYWYDVVEVHCAGAGGKCTREAADAWSAEAKNRKRGRIDPCGSAVVTKLGWETSGGTGDREGGFFRDFTVSFEMEIKRFATQFAPGSTECVPK